MIPRNYLSYSSYSLFKRSPNQWKKKYLLGEEGYSTPEMVFGKKFAAKREEGDETDIENIALFLPKYPTREYEMTAKIDIDGKPVILFGRFDGVDLKKHTIGDDKTGKNFTQQMADKSEQLTFYAFIYYLNKKKIAKTEINWIKTERTEGWVYPTGHVETFKTKRGIEDFLRLNVEIIKVYRGIIK